MKKLLLGLGVALTIVAPVAAVVACGSTDGDNGDNGNGGNGGTPGPVVDIIKDGGVFTGGGKVSESIAELKTAHPGYYNALSDDATGKTLFDELRGIQKDKLTGVGSYSDLWDTYKTAFLDKYDENDGTILDIYSELPGVKDPYEFTPGADQDHGNHSKEADAYNREHMIPQSIFGSDAAHIHNDAHFIFPTDAVVNGARSNYPYDYVDKPSKIFKQGGKLGTGSNGVTAFEPINAFKGDVARATLYFVMTWKDSKYDEHNAKFAPFDGEMIGGIKKDYLQTYLEWDEKDSISQFDVDRNNAIAAAEGGIRNPFVDMPKLVDLIWRSQAGDWTPHTEVEARVHSGTTTTNGGSGDGKPAYVPPVTKTDHTATDAEVAAHMKDADPATYLATEYTYGYIASKHVDAIKGKWEDIKALKTVDAVANAVKDVAYPTSDNSNILNNIKAWLGRVMGQLAQA